MRPVLTKIPLVLGLLALSFAPGKGWADDSNYQSFIVGGRGLGLAGAFTSIADDSSGLFYNPAGIVDTRHKSIQLSSNLYGFERQELSQGSLTLPVPGVEGLRPQFADLIVIPASAGFVSGLGEPEPDGSNRHAYAFSVLVPSFRSRNITLNLDADTMDSRINYRRRVNDRSLWAGFGYAYRVSSRLSLGVSGYYILRNAVDNEQADTSDTSTPNEATFRTASNEVTFTNGSLSIAAGAKIHLAEGLLLGVMLRAPSLHLHSDSSVRFAAGVSVPCPAPDPMDPDPPMCVERSTFDSINIDGARSETQQPLTARVGLSYSKKYWFNLSLDVTYHAPIDYRIINLEPAAEALLPFNPNVTRRSVVNVNLGAEYLLIREVGVAFGFFSDFSSAPKIPEDPDRDYLTRNNLFGTVLSLGYYGKHTLSRVGILYSFGDGKDVIPASNTGNIERLFGTSTDYSRVDIFESFFYVFVSSQFRY